MDLRLGALHIAPLLAGLKVLPPASVRHLPGQQEAAGLGDFHTGGPVETSEARRGGRPRPKLLASAGPQGHGVGTWGQPAPATAGGGGMEAPAPRPLG